MKLLKREHICTPLAIVGLSVSMLFLAPCYAHADDLDFYDNAQEVPLDSSSDNSSDTQPMRAGVAVQASQTGRWITFKKSEGTMAIQTSEYYISPTANSDGSVSVTVRTSLYHKPGTGGRVYWTSTKTLYDNGTKCGYIGEDWDSIAYEGQTISQEVAFSVNGGGTHRITSTETDFRALTGTEAGWDFTVEIPFTITAKAGTGGSISPNGHSLVSPSGSRSYTISASDGYRIDEVLVDDTDCGALNTYTFSNVNANHTISATFKKIWTVTFIDGNTGEVIKTEIVDDRTSATAPTNPEHDEWTFEGWDKDFSNITEDTTITATYKAIIKVRIPTLLPCRITADGSVITPSDYAIENLSCVGVKAVSISTSEKPDDAGYYLRDGDTIIYRYTSEELSENPLTISAKASKTISVAINDVDGDGAWRELAQRAASEGTQTFCYISYVFEEA